MGACLSIKIWRGLGEALERPWRGMGEA